MHILTLAPSVEVRTKRDKKWDKRPRERYAMQLTRGRGVVRTAVVFSGWISRGAARAGRWRRSGTRPVYRLEMSERKQLYPIWIVLMYSTRCDDGMKRKLIACATGHTFQLPVTCVRSSFLVLSTT